MQDLLQLAQDIAQGCHYLEENHFIHRLEAILTQETLGPLAPSAHPSLYIQPLKKRIRESQSSCVLA